MTCVFASCSDDDSGKNSNDRMDIPLTLLEEDIVLNTHYIFGMNVFLSLSEQYKNENFLFSPLGLSMSAGIVANGTNSETRREILSVMCYNENELDALNEINRKIIANIQSLDKTATVSLANAVWYSTGYGGTPVMGIQNVLKNYYSSQLTGFGDLSSSEVVKTINNWCNEHTEGIIPSIMMSPSGPDSRMIFTNVFYFKGIWAEKFDAKFTEDKEFYSESGVTNKIPMMRNPKLMATGYGTDRYTVVSLPYGNGAFSMVVILPDKGHNLSECFTNDDIDSMQKLALGRYQVGLTQRAETKAINIMFPKFSMETNIDFVDILKSLGMEKVFTEKEADFSNFFEGGDYYISSVNQKSKIIVDEEGTTATSVSKWDGSASANFAEQMDFIVDRPFAFIIAERSTGIPLFIGKVSNL